MAWKVRTDLCEAGPCLMRWKKCLINIYWPTVRCHYCQKPSCIQPDLEKSCTLTNLCHSCSKEIYTCVDCWNENLIVTTHRSFLASHTQTDCRVCGHPGVCIKLALTGSTSQMTNIGITDPNLFNLGMDEGLDLMCKICSIK